MVETTPLTPASAAEGCPRRHPAKTPLHRSDGKLMCRYCCTGLRECDDPTHHDRADCPHCGGEGVLNSAPPVEPKGEPCPHGNMPDPSGRYVCPPCIAPQPAAAQGNPHIGSTVASLFEELGDLDEVRAAAQGELGPDVICLRCERTHKQIGPHDCPAPARPPAAEERGEAGEVSARLAECEERIADLQRSRPLCCYGCGRRYTLGPDLIIPRELWERIAPSEHGGGVLCPNCIYDRLVALGVPEGSVDAFFKSGPFADHEARIAALSSELAAAKESLLTQRRAFEAEIAAVTRDANASDDAHEAELAAMRAELSRVQGMLEHEGEAHMSALQIAIDEGNRATKAEAALAEAERQLGAFQTAHDRFAALLDDTSEATAPATLVSRIEEHVHRLRREIAEAERRAGESVELASAVRDFLDVLPYVAPEKQGDGSWALMIGHAHPPSVDRYFWRLKRTAKGEPK